MIIGIENNDLDSYINPGQACLFNFTCDTQNGYTCINGVCCKIDNQKYARDPLKDLLKIKIVS